MELEKNNVIGSADEVISEESQDTNENDALNDDEDFEEETETESGKEKQKTDTTSKDNEDTKDNDEEDSTNEDDKHKEKQSAKKNSFFADLRRANEKAQKEAYRKGIIEANGGVNTFTNEKIETEADWAIYEKMLAAQKAGFEPVTEMYLYDKQLFEENLKSEKQNAQDESLGMEDFSDFNNKFPTLDFEEVFNDERFLRFCNGKNLKGRLAETYQDYLDFKADFDKEADKKARTLIAKTKSSPGGTKNVESSKKAYYTIEQIQGMSQSRVNAELDFINESLEYWSKKKD